MTSVTEKELKAMGSVGFINLVLNNHPGVIVTDLAKSNNPSNACFGGDVKGIMVELDGQDDEQVKNMRCNAYEVLIKNPILDYFTDNNSSEVRICGLKEQSDYSSGAKDKDNKVILKMMIKTSPTKKEMKAVGF